MAESNPHAGTGSYGCDRCGRRFAYSRKEGTTCVDAKRDRDEHVCDGHPLNVIGILKNMCIEREERIDGEWGSGDTSRQDLREEIEQELERRLREQRRT